MYECKRKFKVIVTRELFYTIHDRGKEKFDIATRTHCMSMLHMYVYICIAIVPKINGCRYKGTLSIENLTIAQE